MAKVWTNYETNSSNKRQDNSKTCGKMPCFHATATTMKLQSLPVWKWSGIVGLTPVPHPFQWNSIRVHRIKMLNCLIKSFGVRVCIHALLWVLRWNIRDGPNVDNLQQQPKSREKEREEKKKHPEPPPSRRIEINLLMKSDNSRINSNGSSAAHELICNKP